MTSDDLIKQKWYVAVDDLVGGWIISNVDKPASEIDVRGKKERIVADCISQALAKYITEMHNASL